jgi:hypothetical protein
VTVVVPPDLARPFGESWEVHCLTLGSLSVPDRWHMRVEIEGPKQEAIGVYEEVRKSYPTATTRLVRVLRSIHSTT